MEGEADSPSFVKMKAKFAIVSSFLLLGCCRTKAVTTTIDTARRHADSVAALRSVTASVVTREEVWETVVVRPDTLGNLRVVARDIVRHTGNTSETAIQGDTATFGSETSKDTIHEEKTVQTAQNTARRGAVGFVVGVWVGFTLLTAALALILYAKWKSRS